METQESSENSLSGVQGVTVGAAQLCSNDFFQCKERAEELNYTPQGPGP